MKMALFFPKTCSLETYRDAGTLDREKHLYEKSLDEGVFEKIYFFTYSSRDFEISENMKKLGEFHPEIEIIPMPRIFKGRIGCLLYSVISPLMFWKTLKDVDVIKVDQINGSWAGVIAKWLTGRPLIIRTGYMPSRKKFISPSKRRFFATIENLLYRFCDIAVVTNYQDRNYMIETEKIQPERIKVIPNYVDIGIFRPLNGKKIKNKIVFVGRLSKEKNICNLIEACNGAGIGLDIYGEGEMRTELENLTRKIGANVDFKGTVANTALAETLNRYRNYALVSFSEGMPKSLIEAMACGLVCIGTDVQGINEIIQHGVNGYLSKGTDAKNLLQTIEKAVNSDDSQIIDNAVKVVREKFSLEEVLGMEKQLFSDVLDKAAVKASRAGW